jgi:hypothetical protein
LEIVVGLYAMVTGKDVFDMVNTLVVLAIGSLVVAGITALQPQPVKAKTPAKRGVAYKAAAR